MQLIIKSFGEHLKIFQPNFDKKGNILLKKPRRNKENMTTHLQLPVDDSGSLESSSMQNGETQEPNLHVILHSNQMLERNISESFKQFPLSCDLVFWKAINALAHQIYFPYIDSWNEIKRTKSTMQHSNRKTRARKVTSKQI